MDEFLVKVERSRKRVPSTQRYKNCEVLRDTTSGETILSSYDPPRIKESTDDEFHRVQIQEVGRLDIIAYQYYKNAGYWWVIAEANGLYDIFTEMYEGQLLRIPSLLSLYGEGGILL